MSETQIVSADQLALSAKESCEIIAGYTLEKRIGSGGFGEVWRATAPGGLEKAVKILYGQFDDQQAETELKSLERIRQLHHPFLLNIERIEISSGRLVIVTELAEASLEDYYAACRKRSLDGIPHEELVDFLRDAADALDYMSSKHGLQHLDVKPDNLLLQGSHVKVADFGLTKDLSQSQVSLVGAFTPLYAPPELYEGAPAPSSDQYSLAIVYQTMLTGIPPFVGRTAAQLAAQHLNSQPNLQPLAMTDRPPVARALSKNPEARFPSCREFLEELVRRREGRENRKSRSASAAASGRKPAEKIQPAPIVSGSTELVNAYTESQPLGPLKIEPGSATYRPTLIIGLGGLGGRMLGQLKLRVETRFGPEAELPGLGFLYVDTDKQAVSAAMRGEPGPLSFSETLAIPLRSPQEYKTGDVDYSDWLSRRWLYNIPRSRQVEGMRPLGRLAFADHQSEIRERIRGHLGRLVSADSLTEMREQTGLPFEAGQPNVIVLASIVGGTGSGAALDLGYLVQDELSGMAFEEGDVEGFLLFGTDLRDRDRDLAVANGLCLIHEMDHYARSFYPGDATCRLQDMTTSPFQNTYLIHLGDRLSTEGLEVGTASVAEHIFRKTLTPARAYFQTLREQTELETSEKERLHTFWIPQSGARDDGERGEMIGRLIGQLLSDWTRTPTEADRRQFERTATSWWDNQVRALGWDVPQILEQGIQALEGDFGRKLNRCVQQWLSQRSPALAETSLPIKKKEAEALVRSFDQALNHSADDRDAAELRHCFEGFQTQLQEQARGHRESFEQDLWEALDEWGHPLESANFVIETAVNHLDRCRNEIAQIVQRITGELAPKDSVKGQPVAVPAIRSGESPSQYLERYAGLRFCYEVHRALMNFVGSIRASLGAFPTVLNQIRQNLGHWNAGGSTAEPTADSEIADLAQRFDRELGRSGSRQLKLLSQSSEDALTDWLGPITQQAERFLLFSALHHLDSNPPDGMDSMFLEGGKPHLQGVGGVHSALVVTPEADSGEIAAQVKQVLGDCVTTLSGQNESLFLCCETRNIKLGAIANSLSDQRQDLKEVASRLHARIDVEWPER